MSICNEMPELLSLHLDDELDDVNRGRLRRHLAGCEGCHHLWQQMQAVDSLFRQPPMQVAPAGFTERVVTVAFEAQLRRNLFLGSLSLLIGTLIIGCLSLVGRLDLVTAVVALLLSPDLFQNGSLWLGEIWQSLAIVGHVTLTLLELLRKLMVGPLLLPSLTSLLAAMAVGLLVQRQEQLLSAFGTAS